MVFPYFRVMPHRGPAPLPPRFLQDHAVFRQFFIGGETPILSKFWSQGPPSGQNSAAPPKLKSWICAWTRCAANLISNVQERTRRFCVFLCETGHNTCLQHRQFGRETGFMYFDENTCTIREILPLFQNLTHTESQGSLFRPRKQKRRGNIRHFAVVVVFVVVVFDVVIVVVLYIVDGIPAANTEHAISTLIRALVGRPGSLIMSSLQGKPVSSGLCS